MWPLCDVVISALTPWVLRPYFQNSLAGFLKRRILSQIVVLGFLSSNFMANLVKNQRLFVGNAQRSQDT